MLTREYMTTLWATSSLSQNVCVTAWALLHRWLTTFLALAFNLNHWVVNWTKPLMVPSEIKNKAIRFARKSTRTTSIHLDV